VKLSVVLPTISGREETLARTIAAYEETLRDFPYELIIVKDEPSWPRACNVGYARSTGEVVHWTADDLEPMPDWHLEILDWLEHEDELPAAKIKDYTPDGAFSNIIDGGDLEFVHFTRVPIMRRDQWERIGAWPEDLIYYADLWVSEKARTLGIRTRMFFSYWFVHHWSQIGRVDNKENMDASGWALNRHREAML
jgi:hypothetical protein